MWWCVGLKAAQFIKWPNTKCDRTNNIVVGNEAKATSRVKRVAPNPVVAGHEQTIGGYDGIDFTASRAPGVRPGVASLCFIGLKAVGVFLIIDSEDAVFNDDALTWEGNDALNDKFVATANNVVWVFKDDDITALGDIRFTLQVCPANWKAINNETVAGIEGGLHAWATDIESPEDKGIDKKGANENADNKYEDAHQVLEERVTL